MGGGDSQTHRQHGDLIRVPLFFFEIRKAGKEMESECTLNIILQ
jgi:hypothetical protein